MEAREQMKRRTWRTFGDGRRQIGGRRVKLSTERVMRAKPGGSGDVGSEVTDSMQVIGGKSVGVKGGRAGRNKLSESESGLVMWQRHLDRVGSNDSLKNSYGREQRIGKKCEIVDLKIIRLTTGNESQAANDHLGRVQLARHRSTSSSGQSARAMRWKHAAIWMDAQSGTKWSHVTHSQ
jgi:hypothetical protein